MPFSTGANSVGGGNGGAGIFRNLVGAGANSMPSPVTTSDLLTFMITTYLTEETHLTRQIEHQRTVLRELELERVRIRSLLQPLQNVYLAQLTRSLSASAPTRSATASVPATATTTTTSSAPTSVAATSSVSVPVPERASLRVEIQPPTAIQGAFRGHPLLSINRATSGGGGSGDAANGNANANTTANSDDDENGPLYSVEFVMVGDQLYRVHPDRETDQTDSPDESMPPEFAELVREAILARVRAELSSQTVSVTENTPLTDAQMEECFERRLFRDIANPLQDQCPVSHEPFAPDEYVRLIRRCNHLIGETAFSQWFELRRKSTCPLCRQCVRGSPSQAVQAVAESGSSS